MEILTAAQLAERLHVKATWAYEQTRRRANDMESLPHIKLGKYVRFDWNDVLAWLERQKRGGSKIVRPSR